MSCLLDLGAYVDAVDYLGCTALDHAVNLIEIAKEHRIIGSRPMQMQVWDSIRVLLQAEAMFRRPNSSLTYEALLIKAHEAHEAHAELVKAIPEMKLDEQERKRPK